MVRAAAGRVAGWFHIQVRRTMIPLRRRREPRIASCRAEVLDRGSGDTAFKCRATSSAWPPPPRCRPSIRAAPSGRLSGAVRGGTASSSATVGERELGRWRIRHAPPPTLPGVPSQRRTERCSDRAPIGCSRIGCSDAASAPRSPMVQGVRAIWCRPYPADARILSPWCRQPGSRGQWIGTPLQTALPDRPRLPPRRPAGPGEATAIEPRRIPGPERGSSQWSAVAAPKPHST